MQNPFNRLSGPVVKRQIGLKFGRFTHRQEWRRWGRLRSRPGLRSLAFGMAIVFCMIVLAIAPAHPQVGPSLPGVPPGDVAAPAPLRIATHLMRPDAFEQDGQLVGFSVDIGRAVVKHIHRGQTQPGPIAIATYGKVHEMLAALRAGEADLAVAAIPITSQYEREFDCSHPILAAGLQIMVPEPAQQSRSAKREIMQRIVKPSLLRLSAVVALLMLIPAHVVWYFERKSQNSVIEHTAYSPGIFEALW